MNQDQFCSLLTGVITVLKEAFNASRWWHRTYNPQKVRDDYIPAFLKEVLTIQRSFEQPRKRIDPLLLPLDYNPLKESFEKMEILINIWRNLSCLDDFQPIKSFINTLYTEIHNQLKPENRYSVTGNVYTINQPAIVLFYDIVSEIKQKLETILPPLSAQQQLKLNPEIEHIRACIAHLLKILFALPLQSTTSFRWHNQQLENIHHNLKQLKFPEIQSLISNFFATYVMAFRETWSLSIGPLLQAVLQQAKAILAANRSWFSLSKHNRNLLRRIVETIEPVLDPAGETLRDEQEQRKLEVITTIAGCVFELDPIYRQTCSPDKILVTLNKLNAEQPGGQNRPRSLSRASITSGLSYHTAYSTTAN